MTSEIEPATVHVVREKLRPLEWNELPRRGDFVEDGRKGFEPWTGPTGFRADTFVKQIFRRFKPKPSAVAAEPSK